MNSGSAWMLSAAPLTRLPRKAANLSGLKCSVLRQMPQDQKISATQENSASKSWLRALEMTAKIDAAPERIFPLVIEELGARFGEALALTSPGESFSHAGLAALCPSVRAARMARVVRVTRP